jgi:hypothetical protein
VALRTVILEGSIVLVIHRRILFSLVLAGAAALVGCSGNAPPADPMLSGRIGDNCTVYFRHNTLGMAAASPTGPTVDNHNGGDTAISGKLLRVNAGWICVGGEKEQYTIPNEVILLVKMASK